MSSRKRKQKTGIRWGKLFKTILKFFVGCAAEIHFIFQLK